MKTILAAVDFSMIADALTTGAARLARPFAGRIVFVSVAEPPLVATEYAPSRAQS